MNEVKAEIVVRLWPTRYHVRLTLLRAWMDAEVQAFAATLRGDQ